MTSHHTHHADRHTTRRGAPAWRRTLGCGAAVALVATTLVTQAVPASAGPGDISTVAGTGVEGFSGDFGPATSAQIHLHNGSAGSGAAAFDAAGAMYFADGGNARIRKVDPSGTVTTVAGTGGWGSTGDGAAATAAEIGRPHQVITGRAGDLYISDPGNHRIRRVDSAGTITTVAGTTCLAGGNCPVGDGAPATVARLGEPTGLVLDAAGNLFVADVLHHRVRRIATGAWVAGTPSEVPSSTPVPTTVVMVSSEPPLTTPSAPGTIRRTRWRNPSATRRLPAASSTRPVGSPRRAAVAAPPSPVKAPGTTWAPHFQRSPGRRSQVVPATVVMVPSESTLRIR